VTQAEFNAQSLHVTFRIHFEMSKWNLCTIQKLKHHSRKWDSAANMLTIKITV